MPHLRYSNVEIIRRGEELYAQKIRTKVEGKRNGEFLALDIESGDYEIAPDELAALDRLKRKHPDAVPYILRVGFPTAVKLGATPVRPS